jgi:hypothetical protein
MADDLTHHPLPVPTTEREPALGGSTLRARWCFAPT